MSDHMRSAIMRHKGRIELESRPIPEIGPDDVLVRVAYVGICGSDLALFENGYIGDKVVPGPMGLGHEASGTVVAIGDRVSSLAVGDRVALEPGIPCGHCWLCARGHYNLCRDVSFWASPPVTEGALQEYVRHPASLCFRIPRSMTLLEGALVEPLSVGYYSVLNSGFRMGNSAAVLGAGGVGLLLMLCLRAAGAGTILVSDLHPHRLETAKSIGGERVAVLNGDAAIGDVDASLSDGVDFVFESAGSAFTMNRAISLVRPGGTVVFIGYTHGGHADLNVNLLIDKEVTVKTSFRYRHVYDKVVAAVSSGTISVNQVVSDVFPFDAVQDAMERALYEKKLTTKCVVAVSPESVDD